jgi:predicted amidohydrolase YtcJ
MIVRTTPDLVLSNGKVITVDKNFSICETVAVKDGKILFVGSGVDLRSQYEPALQQIDLKGLTLVPGIIDSHIHMMAIGLERLRLSIAHAQSIADVLDTIREECRRVGPDRWVVTSQIDFSPGQLNEKRLPNRWELDKVSSDNPVMVTRGAHFSVVNSYALRLAAITKDSVPPEGGIIMKDPATGEPTGWLGDTSLQQVRKLIPALSHEERVAALRAAMQELNALGITGIIEASSDRDDPGLRAYKELWSRNELTVRARLVVGAPFTPPPVADIEHAPVDASRRRGLGDDGDAMLRLWGVKLMIDGGVETALLRHPYEVIPGEQEDTEYRGVPMMSRPELYKLCREAARNGWRLGIHTVGDAAMDMVLSVFDEVNKEFPIEGRRWSIMHGFLVMPEHFDVMRRLGITVACQHSHNYTKGDAMVKWWGRERASSGNPVRLYLKEGIPVGGGSDGRSCEWRTNILFWTDVTRQTRFAGALGPELALTREEMVRYHTIDAAYIMAEEHTIGSIEPGKWADLAVLSKDILTCPTDELKESDALMTIVNGKVVYDRRAAIDRG